MYSNYVDHKASSGTHGSAKAVYSFSYTQSIDDLVTHKYFLLVRAHLMQTCSHFSSVCLYLNHDICMYVVVTFLKLINPISLSEREIYVDQIFD